jgi:type IV pilus assembly protein PilE
MAAMKQRGFTLIELMLVVIIIAILGIIGLPSYRAYVQRSQRTEAKDALVRLATNQERFYFQNNTYTANLAQLGFPGGSTDTGLYDLAVVADQLGFTATATPSVAGGMAADVECQSYTIDETTTRTAAPDPNGRCW